MPGDSGRSVRVMMGREPAAEAMHCSSQQPAESLLCINPCSWLGLKGKARAGLRARLAAAPATAAAPYSQGQKRVALLVRALSSAGVFSRAALAHAFARDSTFLKQEIAAWLQKVCADARAVGGPLQRALKHKKRTCKEA